MRESKTVGRITLVLESRDVGSDLFVTLTGGRSHIGAAALGTYDSVSRHTTVSVLCAPGHKEEQIALFGARSFCQAFQKTVLFSAGIHLDQITTEEIQVIDRACRDLISETVSKTIWEASLKTANVTESKSVSETDSRTGSNPFSEIIDFI